MVRRFRCLYKNQNTDQHYNKLLEIIEWKLKSLEQEKLLYVNTKEKIKVIISEEITFELLDRFKQDIHSYSNNEKRALLLLAIKNIKYEFKNNVILIDYRLTPYADIEDHIRTNETVV